MTDIRAVNRSVKSIRTLFISKRLAMQEQSQNSYFQGYEEEQV
jgi:hypothetical protein